MNYYNILPTRNIGGNLAILTFSCQTILEIGQIVEIEIRNSEDFGLVISQNTDCDYKSVGEQPIPIETREKHVSNLADETHLEQVNSKNSENKKNNFEIKEINKVFPFRISKEQIEFLQSFTTNSFNSPNDIWSSIFQPFKLLTKKQIFELENDFAENAKKMTSINAKLEEFGENSNNTSCDNITSTKSTPIIDFILDSDILIRIMYIIRSLTCSDRLEIDSSKTFQKRQLLIIFPEKKFLDKIMTILVDQIKKDKLNDKLKILKYTGEPTKTSKETIWEMIQAANKLKFEKEFLNQNEIDEIKVQIIFTTRSGIFLPFSNLSHIVLVDEGNSLYIQDQNSLYFDARDTIFLLHKAFMSNLTFVSTLPSLRLHNFYNKTMLRNSPCNSPSEPKKPLKLKITTLDTKSAKFGLFGWEVEQILKKDEDFEQKL